MKNSRRKFSSNHVMSRFSTFENEIKKIQSSIKCQAPKSFRKEQTSRIEMFRPTAKLFFGNSKIFGSKITDLFTAERSLKHFRYALIKNLLICIMKSGTLDLDKYNFRFS